MNKGSLIANIVLSEYTRVRLGRCEHVRKNVIVSASVGLSICTCGHELCEQTMPFKTCTMMGKEYLDLIQKNWTFSCSKMKRLQVTHSHSRGQFSSRLMWSAL